MLTMADLDALRTYLRQLRRSIFMNAALRYSLLGCLLGPGIYLLSPWLHGSQLVTVEIAVILGSLGLLPGVFEFIHWARHFRVMSGQLRELEGRVRSGEVINSSEVLWSSYK